MTKRSNNKTDEGVANKAAPLAHKDTSDKLQPQDDTKHAVKTPDKGASGKNTMNGIITSVELLAQEVAARGDACDCCKANAWMWMGNGYAQLEMYEQALQAYQHANEINPEQPFIQMKVAATYLAMDKADKAYELLMDIPEEGAEELGFLYWVTVAKCCDAQGRFEDVRVAAQYALEYEDENPECREVLESLGLL